MAVRPSGAPEGAPFLWQHLLAVAFDPPSLLVPEILVSAEDITDPLPECWALPTDQVVVPQHLLARGMADQVSQLRVPAMLPSILPSTAGATRGDWPASWPGPRSPTLVWFLPFSNPFAKARLPAWMYIDHAYQLDEEVPAVSDILRRYGCWCMHVWMRYLISDQANAVRSSLHLCGDVLRVQGINLLG